MNEKKILKKTDSSTDPEQRFGRHPADRQGSAAVDVVVIAAELRPIGGHVGDLQRQTLTHQTVPGRGGTQSMTSEPIFCEKNFFFFLKLNISCHIFWGTFF